MMSDLLAAIREVGEGYSIRERTLVYRTCKVASPKNLVIVLDKTLAFF
jgi:hypothetical protein